MPKKYDGAYPFNVPGGATQLGLSKREVFAIAALQGLISSTSPGQLAGVAEKYTNVAVMLADALMETLGNTPVPGDES